MLKLLQRHKILRRIVLTIGGAATLSALAALWIILNRPERGLPVASLSLTVATASKGTFHEIVPLRAKVVPLDTVYIDALEGGQIKRILAQPGDSVSEGQPLIELTNTELELDVLDREGRLIESITQLQAYQTGLEQNRLANEKALALIDYNIAVNSRLAEEYNRLEKFGGISEETRKNVLDQLAYNRKLRPIQLESNRTQEEFRVSQVPEIRASITKLSEDVKATQAKLDNLTVRALASGRLTSMDLKIGQTSKRGDRLAEITPDTGVKLTADLDEYVVSEVHKDQSAEIRLDDQSWPLRVSLIYPQVKNGKFSIDLAFSGDAPHGLLPGQALSGKINLGRDHPALLIPHGAFLQTTGGSWIFVLDSDGQTASRRHIVIGEQSPEQVEILDGLQPGDRVIVSDYHDFAQANRIELIP